MEFLGGDIRTRVEIKLGQITKVTRINSYNNCIISLLKSQLINEIDERPLGSLTMPQSVGTSLQHNHGADRLFNVPKQGLGFSNFIGTGA